MGGFTGISQKSQVTLLAVGLLPVVDVLNNSDWAVKGLDLYCGGVCNCREHLR